MVPDGQKVWTDGMDRQMHGRRQKYIPLTSSVDNKQAKSNGNIDLKKNKKNSHSTVHQKLTLLNNYAIYHSM